VSTLPPFFRRPPASNVKGCAPSAAHFLNEIHGRKARIRENRKIRERRGPADRRGGFTRQRNLPPGRPPACPSGRPWADARPGPAAACTPAPGQRTSSARFPAQEWPAPTGHCPGSRGAPAGGRPPAGTARPGLYSAGSVVSGRANCTPYTTGTAPRRYSATAWSFSFSS